MVQVNTVSGLRQESFAALYQMMQANQDADNAEKILDLYQKLQKKELVVSFSGHFSAGKSSMINALLGQDILPKSPIPTSANIVKLMSGEGWARVFFKHGNPVEYKEPYDLDMIKAYSTDKDEIKRIEISTKDAIIPQAAAIMDTPGIDAADDADRLMTESSLHLVDCLFYVMDYNHVQSEVNLYFLQSLQDNRIPFYLIINQVDKHNEEELSFASFKESIRQTFAAWNIYPKDVFYTSLYDRSLAINEFKNVKNTLFSILKNTENTHFNIQASVKQVMEKHKAFLEQQYEDLKNKIDVDEAIRLQLTEMEQAEEQMKIMEWEPEELEEAFQAELKQTLQNAYLMPKELRDLAARFLEAEQPGFKIGLFGSKKKTTEEKLNRQNEFEKAIQETIRSSVQWKLRDKYVQLSKDYGLTDQALMEEVNNFSIHYDSSDFERLLKQGAQVNGEYILNYTNDVASDIKAKFRRRSLSLLQTMKQTLSKKHADKLNNQQPSIENLEEVRIVTEKYNKIHEELEGKQRAVDRMFDTPQIDDKSWEQTLNKVKQKQKKFVIMERAVYEKNPVEIEEEIHDADQEVTDVVNVSAEQMLSRIEQTIKLTEGLPGFADLIADLKIKQDRLDNRTFTIALFGAFSAGKSSFSNALIGEKVLPVSPNPTTATVNRIHPVTNEHPHGTVIVTMKQETDLYEELMAMTRKFSPKGENLERLLTWIEKKNITGDARLNKMYQAYIRAVMKGYIANKEYIGKEREISFDEFGIFVADETMACFVETIDVYYDSSITRQGITLVDTPGADSVNARHTNVAFNYIKHADAILYVTYYNHALSRADRDFLLQLGRVKEAFQLDKMFFIVNAADLAESEEELELVTSYVKDELTKLGIRNGRLFPVSSKLSLEEKLQQLPLNKQMDAFEQQFYFFIHHDLAALTLEGAIWDMRRIYETMDHYIASITLDEASKEQQKQRMKQDKAQAAAYINTYETDVYKQQLEQRVEKQLYYVLERLGIRYHDMFKEMFNPTTITENGRKANNQLKNALENLIEYIRFELNQELQAVSLRMEHYVLRLANEVYQAMQVRNKEIDALFALPNQFDYELYTPDYEEKLIDVQPKHFQHIIGKYKGTKAFFVQNEKETMKEELYELLFPLAEHFIKVNKDKMTSGYRKQWEELIGRMKESSVKRLDQQVNNYFTMLATPAELPRLKANLQQLEELVKEEKVGVEL
ncbi:dynamin family protein [Oceanobacillus alkalisoli]|uniref:dynamin family protein n=1 Tax=Oceanobacillus alkalisoli TaxID=2925113 RepID=UPI001EE4D123|nr:dynamin family protein [Oceanobacillus alkalisoli]MCG5105150.1 dynamin family protein [Oceanobacillus alkalisoli]